MKYYYGNSYKEAMNNPPVEIASTDVLQQYNDNYTFVIEATPDDASIKSLYAKAQDAVEAIGGEINFIDYHDARHLNCWWYGGQVASFSVGGNILSIEANGDIRLSGKDFDFVDKNNGGTLYDELGEELDDDELESLIDSGDLYVGNNNWFEVFLLDGDKFVDCFDYGDTVLSDNIFEAVIDAANRYPDIIKAYQDTKIK